ncbi:MAG: hypothetical protein ONB48_15035 [candidate division KSB1 bacterium]|nr:hypothetical protein [candidate division KSB1 bacterium]MDZ7273448.1 hypothetical protein [candidate division KSB1 bacterium]MDZ7286960.1 hypothetical protein [candidate division KSB1 bacterium]MDZ7299687.1 hypothetical protein [candidate division KSB1 bacterium]MDZ7307951.1 hypothetical protein [candidate division KSB1 bacterium]
MWRQYKAGQQILQAKDRPQGHASFGFFPFNGYFKTGKFSSHGNEVVRKKRFRENISPTKAKSHGKNFQNFSAPPLGWLGAAIKPAFPVESINLGAKFRLKN